MGLGMATSLGAPGKRYCWRQASSIVRVEEKAEDLQ